jgi:translation initiation factor IF-2
MKKKKTSKTGNSRPPIVTILGHVDHGKTSLLDKIRDSNVVSKEAGGITQRIGASVITTPDNNKITFIDTPGHAAFNKMRSRGASAADLVILVVAANEGIKTQTIEALRTIKEVKIPFLVAATKIDLPSASPQTIKQELEKKQVSFEGSGGDVPFVLTSAKGGKGINELLEIISLMSEVYEIKADPNAALDSIVIETSKDKRGVLVTVVVKNGTLKKGDKVSTNNSASSQQDPITCRVRGLFDDNSKPVSRVLPGYPAQILGFSNLPEVGCKIIYQENQKELTTSPETKKTPRRKVNEGDIPIVIKARRSGLLEVLKSNLPEKIAVVHEGVGDVSESDVFIAKSANGIIFAFESKTQKSVSNLADTEGVSIETFDVIYDFIERLQEIVEEKQEKSLGEAEIIASFPFNDREVAGCKVTKGIIKKNDKLILKRESKEIGEIKAVSIKKQKKDISEVKEGEEFGILFEPKLDFEKGDVIVSVENE